MLAQTPELPIGRFRATFQSSESPRHAGFPGSAWRGALGHALKRTVCVTRQPRCADCLLYHSCVYSYFFDTPPAADSTKMRRYVSSTTAIADARLN